MQSFSKTYHNHVPRVFICSLDLKIKGAMSIIRFPRVFHSSIATIFYRSLMPGFTVGEPYKNNYNSNVLFSFRCQSYYNYFWKLKITFFPSGFLFSLIWKIEQIFSDLDSTQKTHASNFEKEVSTQPYFNLPPAACGNRLKRI